jgi:hypothetical protein
VLLSARVAVHVEISPDIGKRLFFFCGNMEIWGNSVKFVVCSENFWGNLKKTRKKEESACFLSYFRNNF